MDADGLTFACATSAEERVARRAGLKAVCVGLGVANGIPDGRLVSFGVAGSLGDLQVGDVLDATRVVDETGATLWEGPGLGVRGARAGVVLGGNVLVHDAAARDQLRAASGADAVDMESATLARSGGLAGCIRAISDTPSRKLGGLAQAAKPTGEIDYRGLLLGFLRAPVETVRAAAGARQALKALEAVA